jgi:nitrate/nitrite transport system substrate-binding protein
MVDAAWIAGSDAPEQTELRVGFLPLTDCASVIVAAERGFDRKHGIEIVPVRAPSWAAIRDQLLRGELDAAHTLYGLVYGVELGIGGVRADMAVLMTLNQNGQGITFSNQLREHGVTDGATLKRCIERGERELVFAQTFPTGTHALWLYYWLSAQGIHPFADVQSVTVPPAQMVASLRTGRIDGCCVGEPWNAGAVHEGVGFTVATSQQIWPDHPEKVLAATRSFAEQRPNAARALIMALLEASRFVDDPANRPAIAYLLARPEYIDTDAAVIEPRFLGRYDDGRGNVWQDPHAICFHGDGEVNFPYLSDGMWFMRQHRRWGLLATDPDYLAVAQRVNRIELYREAAARVGVALPAGAMRSSRLIDGTVWDGTGPAIRPERSGCTAT